MRIAVASGKGGTGKTLFSTNLAHLWSMQGQSVTYVDADVEEPNGHLFLKPEISVETRFRVRIPSLGDASCAGHGKCQEICAFNAILSVGGKVIVFNELCHSCGACVLACPENTLFEVDREIGTICEGRVGSTNFLSGRLDVGEAKATPLIEEVVTNREKQEGLVIIDAPPGTSCSAIAAVRGSDLLLLVTEPTPFGLHDLELALRMGQKLGLKIAAVINRADLGNSRVQNFLNEEGIPILGKFPFDRRIAEKYANGNLPVVDCTSFKSRLTELGSRILKNQGGVQ